MPLPSVYTQVYGQIPDFMSKIQDGQAPASFTQQHLKDIGFTSSNHKAFIPLLKGIGFLSADGAPTTRYQNYRNKAQSRQVLGEALKEAYSDLFVIKANPAEKDKALIEGKFKSTHNVTDRPAELMARTFFALLKIADVEHAQSPAPSASSVEVKVEDSDNTTPKPLFQHIKAPSLHYNIQIHLPATKDVEVYNAIFKSLKEHLIG